MRCVAEYDSYRHLNACQNHVERVPFSRFTHAYGHRDHAFDLLQHGLDVSLLR